METIKQLERGCERPILNHPQKLVCGEFMELCSECKARLSQTMGIVKIIEGLKKKEEICMEKDKHNEQVLEHASQIEMADKILAEIKGEK